MRPNRRKNLTDLAKKILEDMEDHQLFGFILSHIGKKGVPEIVKIWGESVTAETAVKPKEDLIQLVKRD
ncbi:MAG: hypothetical protein ACE5QW_00475 [Thermoplasmata archaeon]